MPQFGLLESIMKRCQTRVSAWKIITFGVLESNSDMLSFCIVLITFGSSEESRECGVTEIMPRFYLKLIDW